MFLLNGNLCSSNETAVFFLGKTQAVTYYSVMLKLKSTVAILLGALLVLIAFQNMSPVELTFLFWTFETRRIVLIAICVVTGFLLGRIISTHKPKAPEDH